MNLHLGCGQVYHDGWINMDIDSPIADVKHDLRKTLPYSDRTIDHIYSEHFIEHLSREEGRFLLGECQRVLKPKGILRLSTPDLKWLVEKYLSREIYEWQDVGWLPDSPCAMMNEGMRLWGHRYVYDYKELSVLLKAMGFKTIKGVKWRRSDHALLNNLESRPYHREIIIEASTD